MKSKKYPVLGLVMLAVIAAYANHFGNGFHFDDFHTVVDNPAIRSLHNVPRYFTDATTFSVLPANRTYRPVVSASLALDYALGHGYSPFWFHLSTLVLFLALVGVLFELYLLLLDKLRPGRTNAWIAMLGAAWFGLHPAMAETVNYVIQRGDLYCTLGCVAALWVYARFPNSRKNGLYLLPLIFGLLSKPPAAVFPVLLFLYVFFFEVDLLPGGQAVRWKRSAIAATPSVVLVAALLALQSAMTPKSFTPSMISPWDYRLTQPFVWLRYFGALVLPLHLNVDTDLKPFGTLNAEAAAGLVFLVVLVTAIWFTARHRRLYPIAFGLLWFVVTQLPTSLYPLSEVENDHRMFFSFVGLILAALWAPMLLVQRVATTERKTWLQPVLPGVAIVALCGYGYGVHQRNIVWASEDSLWADDVQKSPHNGRGLMIYGLTRMNKGLYPEALRLFERAQVETPNYPTLEINLGVVNGAMSDGGDTARAAEAEFHFRRAVSLAPGDDNTHAYYGRWLKDHQRYAEALTELQTAISLNPDRLFQREQMAQTYAAMGNAEQAQAAVKAILAMAPNDAEAAALTQPPTQNVAYWINLSLGQYQRGEFSQSIESARKALALDATSAEAYNNIGAAYGGLQQWDDGIENERSALRLKPDFQLAQNNLKWELEQKAKGRAAAPAKGSVAELLGRSLALNQAGKYEESLMTAREALRLDPRSAIAWNNIAAANEALHRWDEAINAAQKAIALQPDFQLAKNNLAWSLSQKKLRTP